MCGILAALGLASRDYETTRRMMLRLSKLLRHRGPDSNMLKAYPEAGVYMAHERLNIVDTSDAGRSGMFTMPAYLLLLCFRWARPTRATAARGGRQLP